MATTEDFAAGGIAAMKQTRPEKSPLTDTALALVRTKQNKLDFVNDVLDWLVEVDAGAKVYWNTFDSDKEVRKAFRAFLTALGLTQLEKKTLQNGSTIYMAFIKAIDDGRPSVLNDARSALAFALEITIGDQVASLREKLIQRAKMEDEEGPAIATDERINFAEAASDARPDPQPRGEKPLGSGLLSLEAYKELHASQAFEASQASGATEDSMEEETLGAVTAPNIFDKSARDNAAIAKFAKAQRLQNELWGLSATRQNKLRRHLEGP